MSVRLGNNKTVHAQKGRFRTLCGLDITDSDERELRESVICGPCLIKRKPRKSKPKDQRRDASILVTAKDITTAGCK